MEANSPVLGKFQRYTWTELSHKATNNKTNFPVTQAIIKKWQQRPLCFRLQILSELVVESDVTNHSTSSSVGVGTNETKQSTSFGSKGNFFGGEDYLLDEEGLLLDTLAPVVVLVRFKYSQTVSSIHLIFTSCKYGENCKTFDCLYSHPIPLASNLS